MTNGIVTKRVQRGDCAWNAAKQNLQAQNKKPTNAEIVKEMNRLAKLNGCKDANDFNNKFFTRAEKEYVVEKKSIPQQKPVPKAERNDSTTVKSDSTRVNTKKDSTVVKKPAPVAKQSANSEVDRINGMKNDRARIIEYNKKNYDGQYYGIVDKKTCKLNIYNKQGEIVKSFNVGVGKAMGDNLQSGYQSKDKRKKESGRYTTAGEFTLDEHKEFKNANYISKKDGKHKIMALKGDNWGEDAGQESIHMIPHNRSERKAGIQNGTKTRVSYGCVNLTEENYDEMHKYLGEGDKIYILPEEKGNKLQLEKQNDGTYKFEQAYHKKQKRGTTKEEASKVYYDIRPDKNPTYIAQQKAKKEAQEKLIAQQKAQQEAQKKAEESIWYKPWTWKWAA